jgi:hypothetical protein
MPRDYVWVNNPKPKKPTENTKYRVEIEANDLVNSYLKPTYVIAPPDDPEYPYVVDIQTRWRGSYFYFVGVYRDPRPDAISPTFEDQFARLTCMGTDSFIVSYKRHTGKYCEIGPAMSLKDALEMIREVPIFAP